MRAGSARIPARLASFELLATAPSGHPNPSLSKSLTGQRGRSSTRLIWPCPEASLIRGRVTEEKSGKPVAGARISFGGATSRRTTRSAQDGHRRERRGRFVRAPGLAGPGYLIVLGPTDDYVLRAEDGDRLIAQGTPATPAVSTPTHSSPVTPRRPAIAWRFTSRSAGA